MNLLFSTKYRTILSRSFSIRAVRIHRCFIAWGGRLASLDCRKRSLPRELFCLLKKSIKKVSKKSLKPKTDASETVKWLQPDASPVLNELLQLLDLAAQLFSRREAFRHLHKKGRNLVAAQQACNTTLQPVKDAGLHHSYTHTRTHTQGIGQYLPKMSLLL